MNINSQKGFAIPLIIAIIVILAAGGIYYSKHSAPISDSSELEVNSAVSQVTIVVPENVDAYKKAVSEFVQIGGQNPVKNWKFVPMNVNVATTTDVIGTTAEMAARYITTQGSSIPNQIAYFKVVDGTAYVVLAIQEDGWAGVSVSIAMIQPIVERSLLQFPDIKKVEFKRYEGEAKAVQGETAGWKTYRNDKYGFTLEYPSYGYTTKDTYRYSAGYGSYTIEFRMPSQSSTDNAERTQALFIEIYPKDWLSYVQNKGSVNTTIGGIPATQTEVKSTNGLDSRHIYFVKGDIGYDIQMIGPGFEDAVKMLSTLKFTN